MVINELELNGWKILKVEDQMIFAERRSTGKKAFFVSDEIANLIGETEIIRVWTKKGFHPFIYKDSKFYDLLFDEYVRFP